MSTSTKYDDESINNDTGVETASVTHSAGDSDTVDVHTLTTSSLHLSGASSGDASTTEIGLQNTAASTTTISPLEIDDGGVVTDRRRTGGRERGDSPKVVRTPDWDFAQTPEQDFAQVHTSAAHASGRQQSDFKGNIMDFDDDNLETPRTLIHGVTSANQEMHGANGDGVRDGGADSATAGGYRTGPQPNAIQLSQKVDTLESEIKSMRKWMLEESQRNAEDKARTAEQLDRTLALFLKAYGMEATVHHDTRMDVEPQTLVNTTSGSSLASSSSDDTPTTPSMVAKAVVQLEKQTAHIQSVLETTESTEDKRDSTYIELTHTDSGQTIAARLDTGADTCVIPSGVLPLENEHDMDGKYPTMITASAELLEVNDKVDLTLDLGETTINVPFYVADARGPLLAWSIVSNLGDTAWTRGDAQGNDIMLGSCKLEGDTHSKVWKWGAHTGYIDTGQIDLINELGKYVESGGCVGNSRVCDSDDLANSSCHGSHKPWESAIDGVHMISTRVVCV